jgi:hypothetical protein
LSQQISQLNFQRPLTRPVVLDPLGKLYNKDALIEYFLDRSKYGDGDRICGYLKGVKVSFVRASPASADQ